MFFFLLLNVQSIRNKTDEFSIFLEDVNGPEIVLLTEHWLKPNEPCCVPGYLTVSIFVRENSIHGGTAILLKQNVYNIDSVSPVLKYNALLVEREFEFSIIYIRNFNMYVVCMYRPPGCDLTVFFQRLDGLLCSLPLNSRLVLGGDLNVNYDNKASLQTQALDDVFGSYNLRMHVTSPTHITRNCSSILDYFCTNFDLEDGTVEVLPAALSDHESVLVGFAPGVGQGFRGGGWAECSARKISKSSGSGPRPCGGICLPVRPVLWIRFTVR